MNMPVFPENFSYCLAKPCNVDVDIPPQTKTKMVTGVHMNMYNEMMSSCITMEIILFLDNAITVFWSFPGVRCSWGVTPHPLLVPRSKIE
jgi:hypothetical protein